MIPLMTKYNGVSTIDYKWVSRGADDTASSRKNTPFSVRCERVAALPYSRILGQGYHRAQVGKSGPGIPFTQPSLEGIAGRPSPTMRREGIASSQLLLFISSHDDFLFINGEACYSHQLPGGDGRFLGRYRAEERFLGRLCGRRLGGRDPRLWGGSGQRVVSSRPDSGMSKTVGGRSARLTAAASGGAASISSLVSGQAARGWGCTRPGLSPPAILPSLAGSVNDTFLVNPEGDPEKESRWDRWRAGEERPDPEKESRRDLRAESCWMLDLAGLYRRPDSGWSGSNRRSELWLAVILGCCGCCKRWKARGCFTGPRIADPGDPLVPGWLPVSLEGELWLAAGPDCFSFLLHGRNFHGSGSLRGASWGGKFSLLWVWMPWSLEGEGEVRSPWSLEGGGAGSGIQLRWLFQGG